MQGNKSSGGKKDKMKNRIFFLAAWIGLVTSFMDDAQATSFFSSTPDEGTGEVNSNGALVNISSNKEGANNNMNVCPMPLSSFGNSIPKLPCGGIVQLNNQPINLGHIQIGTSSGIATDVLSNPTVDSWCTDGTVLTGTDIAVPNRTVSLLLPGTYTPLSYASGSFIPPLGSILIIPDETPVSLSLTTPGTITMPSGGSFMEPDGVTSCFVPVWSTITSVGNGDIYFNDGATCSDESGVPPTMPSDTMPPAAFSYHYQSTLSISTNDILLGAMSVVPNSLYSFRVDIPGAAMFPGGGTFIGPISNNQYSLVPNGMLIALGNGKVQMSGDGGLYTYAPEVTNVGVVAPYVITPYSVSLPIDATGTLFSPQNSLGTCNSMVK